MSTKSRKWCLTLNNYTEAEIGTITEFVKDKKVVFYIVGQEVGEKGTPHLQMYFELNSPRALTFWKNQISDRVHAEIAKKCRAANVHYCSKEKVLLVSQDSFFVADRMTGKELYPWQQEIMDMIKEEPDDRKIYWYWETRGGVGKSCFAKHLALKYDAWIMTGKAADMKHAIADSQFKPTVIVMDFPRSMLDYVSYPGIEEIKNGMFFSGKYESKMCLMNSPHIIVFANSPPDMSKLSADRWVIREIVQPLLV